MFAGKDFTPAKIDEVQENSPAQVWAFKKMMLFILLTKIKLRVLWIFLHTLTLLQMKK